MHRSPLTLLALALCLPACAAAAPPNILWIVFEDISPNLGAYGDGYAATPNLDRFARESVRFTRAFANSGVCAPARSTLITGMYPPAIGTHHMRSSGVPPDYVRGFTESLREAGYYVSNHSKTDYNWKPPASTWDMISPDWREQGWRRRDGKPFFAVVNITDTHSSQMYQPWFGWPERYESLPAGQRHDPDQARVAPYYPDTQAVRQAYARYADNISFADGIVGQVLDQLEADRLEDSTIVFFYSDHGAGMPRSKSFLFESSMHVPLLIRFPEAFAQWAPAEPGSVTDRMVSFVDFAPTVLSLAGLAAPEHFHGTAFLGAHAGPDREFVFGYRDRVDERYEFIRSVRGQRFKYIRNYFPHLPWFHVQTRLYPSTHPVAKALHAGAASGSLRPPAAVYMARTKPREQLFDMQRDPHELRDLAGRAGYRSELDRMRATLRNWTLRYRDLGFLPESDMWLRFDGAAATAFDGDPLLYPIEKILETADWVGRGPRFVAKQKERLADPDSTVRFWAAVGLLANGEAAAAASEALQRALSDPSEAVATIAAQALCRLRESEEPLALLLRQLRHEDGRVALRAANAIHQLGPRAESIRDQLIDYHASASDLVGREFFRNAEYPHWVLRAMLGASE